MEMDVTIYSSEAELVKEATNDILQEIRIGLEKNRQFNISLTGGTLGNQLSESLAKQINGSQWKGLHIWWSDERFASLNTKERNDFIFSSLLNSESALVNHRTLPPSVSVDLDKAANDMNETVKEFKMDLNILGIGPDGHIASLFPGAIHLDETRDAIAISDSPKPPPERVSFTIKKFNESVRTWIVASGEAKREAIAKLLQNDASIPASHIKVSRLLLTSSAFPDE